MGRCNGWEKPKEDGLKIFTLDGAEPRRRSLVTGGVAGLAATALPAFGAAARASAGGLEPIPTRQLGAITGNDLASMDRWARWLGRTQDHDLLAFDQRDWRQLDMSIDFIATLGSRVIGHRRKVQWSVPVGGWSAYDSVVSGQQDAVYDRMARAILAAYRDDATSRICIRLPWEFNMPDQTQAAKTVFGVWDGRLYIHAYRRIADIFRKVSPRFYFDWCPNVGQGEVDPELCYPGDDVVDVISVDIYYRKQYDDQGKTDAGTSIFYYRKGQPRGLDWLDKFSVAHRKLVGVSEWGVDSNSAVMFTEMLIGWMKGLGPRLSHQNYWDRNDGGVIARISDGSLPAIGGAYRQAWGKVS